MFLAVKKIIYLLFKGIFVLLPTLYGSGTGLVTVQYFTEDRGSEIDTVLVSTQQCV